MIGAATVGIGQAIITELTLSFLGLGFPTRRPNLGPPMYNEQNFLDHAPYSAVFPGLLTFLTVLSINYIGHGLWDALHSPRTHRTVGAGCTF